MSKTPAHPDEVKKLLLEKIKTLENVCDELNIDGGIKDRLSKLKERLESPFVITVFGEVNAGKSSFLNALLGIPDLCKTDVDICTDRITVIKYSEKPYRKELDNLTEEVGVNNPLLKGFTIVDTPGINSVLEHHTYITEKFLPSSDVILVVLPALNPHTKQIWEWIERISKDFGKKLVFILQQKDLLSPEGLEKIVRRTEQYARDRGITTPHVFPVSALWELKGKSDVSGFEPLRTFLNTHYTGETQLLVKYETARDELIKLYSDCLRRIEELKERAENLKKRLEETLKLLKKRRQTAEEYKHLLLQSVENKVTRLADRVSEKLESVPIWDITIRRKRFEKFLEELKEEITEELKEFVEGTLIPKLELFESGVLKPALEEAIKRVEEFRKFYRQLGKKGESPLRGEEVVQLIERGIDEINAPGGERAVAVIGGSLLAGALIALLSGSLLVDITGGLISAIGISLGSLYILGKKRKLEREMRKLFEEKLGKRLKKEITSLVEDRLNKTIGVMIEHLQDRIKLLEGEMDRLERARQWLLREMASLKRLELSSGKKQ